MAHRLMLALVSSVCFAAATCESALAAAPPIEPSAGVVLSGAIQFPREQAMTVATGPRDGSRLTVAMGFDGKCRGGGIGETWASNIPTDQIVRVKDGKFSAKLTGVMRRLGGVDGRSGEFRWALTGRFIQNDVALATVTGTANVRVGGRVVSRCKIAEPATVRLAIRST
jgi:hypothetical protein